jgi:hypothetical protein
MKIAQVDQMEHFYYNKNFGIWNENLNKKMTVV